MLASALHCEGKVPVNPSLPLKSLSEQRNRRTFQGRIERVRLLQRIHVDYLTSTGVEAYRWFANGDTHTARNSSQLNLHVGKQADLHNSQQASKQASKQARPDVDVQRGTYAEVSLVSKPISLGRDPVTSVFEMLRIECFFWNCRAVSIEQLVCRSTNRLGCERRHILVHM
jgi:hypothetical protein